MAKEFVDFTQNEYFDAKVSLDGEDIKLKPKNDRALDFVGDITINGEAPGGSQVQADWAETDSEEVDYIKNKPTLATVATSGDYDDLTDKPFIPTMQQVETSGTEIAKFWTGDGDSDYTSIYAPAGGGLTNFIEGTAPGSLKTLDAAADTTNYSLGENSLAIGPNTKAGNSTGFPKHSCALSIGDRCIAFGNHSITLGVSAITEAGGQNSLAVGNTVSANCSNGIVAGQNCTIGDSVGDVNGGANSIAVGDHIVAKGQTCQVFGTYTVSQYKSQFVFGEYNIVDSTSGSRRQRGNYVEIVGNGTSAADRSNARTLDWSGNEMLAGNLTLGGTSGVKLRSNNAALETSSDGGTTWNPVGGGSTGTDYVQPSSVGATIALDSDKFYDLGTITSDLTISFNAAASGKLSNYQGQFTYDGTGSPVPTITFPNTVTWKVTPSYLDGKTYQFSIVNGMGVIIEF